MARSQQQSELSAERATHPVSRPGGAWYAGKPHTILFVNSDVLSCSNWTCKCSLIGLEKNP